MDQLALADAENRTITGSWRSLLPVNQEIQVDGPKSAHLSELARAQTEGCIQTLVKIRDSGKASAAARIAAARELLDRGYGRAPQGITLGGDVEAGPLIFRWKD